jgi:Carbohydrate-binding family 9
MQRVFASNIKKSAYEDSLVGLSSLLNGFETQPLLFTPWIKFPYKPEVSFAIAHSDDYIFLKYFVAENTIRAVNTQVNSSVWEDSCVEFFIDFNDGKGYYNFEFNCIGTPLAGFGKTKLERDLLPEALVTSIKTESFISKVKMKEGVYWELSVAIPLNVFVHHNFSTLVGRQGRVNFYKCGDKLPAPHFLAWCEIQSTEPNFHLPEFFGEIHFK